ncbi:hypothetical protein ONZ45_g6119 [Pleurotus djamor]|nr:hypothetical protein ONZ45_g6119 [Pleurotus djamor]
MIRLSHSIPSGGHRNSNKPSRNVQKVLNAPASRFVEFFSRYPKFPYDPKASVSDEFQRMCAFFKWKKSDSKRKEAHDAFKDSLVFAFNERYGEDEDDIKLWKKLCKRLKLEPIPDTLKECRKVKRLSYPLRTDIDR